MKPSKFTIKPKRKKALWTTVRGAKPVRSRAKQTRQKPPRKRVAARSAALTRRMALYRPMRSAFLGERKTCECVWYGEPCRNAAQDVHHVRGRAGALLSATRYWKAVCRTCHERIQREPTVAQVNGLLALRGEWNKQDEL